MNLSLIYFYCFNKQRSRYTRVNSLGGSLYGGAAEYDDPANCAEEDQYGSQYQPYGAPCDHYGSRKSIGKIFIMTNSDNKIKIKTQLRAIFALVLLLYTLL